MSYTVARKSRGVGAFSDLWMTPLTWVAGLMKSANDALPNVFPAQVGSSWFSTGTSAVTDAITPTPGPPTMTGGTPQAPANYDTVTGQCYDSSGNVGICDTNTPAYPATFMAGSMQSASASGSLILVLLGVGGVIILSKLFGGRK